MEIAVDPGELTVTARRADGAADEVEGIGPQTATGTGSYGFGRLSAAVARFTTAADERSDRSRHELRCLAEATRRTAADFEETEQAAVRVLSALIEELR